MRLHNQSALKNLAADVISRDFDKQTESRNGAMGFELTNQRQGKSINND